MVHLESGSLGLRGVPSIDSSLSPFGPHGSINAESIREGPEKIELCENGTLFLSFSSIVHSRSRIVLHLSDFSHKYAEEKSRFSFFDCPFKKQVGATAILLDSMQRSITRSKFYTSHKRPERECW